MKNLDLRVPYIDGTLAEIEAKHLGFGYGNGDGLARSFEDVARPWSGDQHVALRQLTAGVNDFDCVHSLYGAAMEMQTFSMSFITAHGLFCLAAHLKANPSAELATFTGIVYGFGSSKLVEKHGMNERQAQGSPWMAQDLKVPVLYLMNGRPASICGIWHTDSVADDDNALLAFSSSDVSLAIDCLAQQPVEV